MSKVTAAFLVALASAWSAQAANPEDLAWTENNSAVLQSLGREAIEAFVNRISADDVQHTSVGEFAWADVAGDGRYDLIATADTTGRAFFDMVYVYRRDDHGKIQVQSIPGTEIHDLSRAIRDLNDDRKQELIIPSGIDAQGPGGAFSPAASWPKVYRLRNGKYADSSRDFAGFYDAEVLPELQRAIDVAQGRADVQRADDAEACLARRKLAALEMSRDKVLRVLGRDPTAGLASARGWVASTDRCLLGNAIIVLRDIGGHRDELRAAEEAQRAALERKQAIP